MDVSSKGYACIGTRFRPPRPPKTRDDIEKMSNGGLGKSTGKIKQKMDEYNKTIVLLKGITEKYDSEIDEIRETILDPKARKQAIDNIRSVKDKYMLEINKLLFLRRRLERRLMKKNESALST